VRTAGNRADHFERDFILSGGVESLGSEKLNLLYVTPT
jgi:hypothetical protein